MDTPGLGAFEFQVCFTHEVNSTTDVCPMKGAFRTELPGLLEQQLEPTPPHTHLEFKDVQEDAESPLSNPFFPSSKPVSFYLSKELEVAGLVLRAVAVAVAPSQSSGIHRSSKDGLLHTEPYAGLRGVIMAGAAQVCTALKSVMNNKVRF